MATAEYRLKAVPVYAEQVPADVTAALEVATRWGASVLITPSAVIQLTLMSGVAPGANRAAEPGDWLLDKTGEGKGCCTNEEFVASFEEATP